MKQQGFTLIELVAVIVLLGILAVSALPRFIDLQGDARAATLDGIAGALRATDAQVYAKALVSGQTALNGSITDAGQVIELRNGHPEAVAGDTVNNLDITTLVPNNEGKLIGWARNAALTNTTLVDGVATVYLGYTNTCYVSYAEAASAAAGPTITVVKTSC